VRQIAVAGPLLPPLGSAREWEAPDVPETVRRCQADIAWAEHLVIVYPLWLGGMPAMLKGFLEQVLRPGFAVGKQGEAAFTKLLHGRSARIVVTMGMPALVYRWYFGAHSLKSLERNILRFCGIGPIRESLIGSVEALGAIGRTKWLGRMQALGRRAA
jgi:putative NADPH-quinone reductase